jgi:hypothetical protein
VKRRRDNILKQIRRAKSAGAQSEIAWFGRELSNLERTAESYLFFSQPGIFYDNICRESSASDLCGFFLDALDAKDGNALRSLASFIERFPHEPQDKFRLEILAWKESCDEKRRKMSLNKLAKVIGWPDFASLDQLRRMAKELKFPLATR